jgi:hypothetical protein
MHLCAPGARQFLPFLACVLALSLSARTAQADDMAIFVSVSFYDGDSWAVEGWVFADDPTNLPVVISGLPEGATVTAYCDETGYFLYFVQLDGPTTITATVTDAEDDSASNYASA